MYDLHVQMYLFRWVQKLSPRYVGLVVKNIKKGDSYFD